MEKNLKLVYLFPSVIDCCCFEGRRLWEKAADCEWLGVSRGKHSWMRGLFCWATCSKSASFNPIENIAEHVGVIKLKPQLRRTVFQVYSVYVFYCVAGAGD